MFILYILWSFVYSVFSFSLTDPNLVISQADGYVAFQAWMWANFFNNPRLLTGTYIFLLSVAFGVYFLLYRRLKSHDTSLVTGRVEACALYRTTNFSVKYLFSSTYKKALLFFLLLILPLTFSYNALSHDVFNYMFNAKMVVEFGANPHEQVALDFAEDPWVRFMHNTHTPAPYGYGWTAVSTIPYMLGFGRFILTWLSFRFFSIISVVALYISLHYFSVEMRRKYLSLSELFIVFCNPLFLIEVISNSHNDLWMMVPAVVSFGLLFSLLRKKYVPTTVLTVSAALLLFSITIKFATAVLLLPWLFLLILHAFKLYALERARLVFSFPFALTISNFVGNIVFEKLFLIFPFIFSVLLFIPLLTARSQQFHPWYLLWVFIWIPFIKNTVWRVVLLAFSVSSLARYIPWLWAGNFEGSVLLTQKMITWVTVIVVLVVYYAFVFRKKPYWWK